MKAPDYQLRLNRDDGWSMDHPHFHEEMEVLLPLSASGSFFVDHRRYPLHRGMLFVLGRGTLHRSIAGGGYRRYVLHLPLETVKGLSFPDSDLLPLCEGVRCARLDEDALARLEGLFRRLDLPDEGGFGAGARRAVRLLEFLLELSRLLAVSPELAAPPCPELEEVAPVLRYLRANLARPLTLDGLAAHFYMDKFHLCHRFKAATGFGVMEYLIHCRVLRAQELLRGGMRVQEAGEAAGFGSNSHFIRTFGRLTGDSPKQYAKKHGMGGPPKPGGAGPPPA